LSRATLDQGKFAVIPVDMCGAIAMKRSFPTHIIYVARDKEKLIFFSRSVTYSRISCFFKKIHPVEGFF